MTMHCGASLSYETGLQQKRMNSAVVKDVIDGKELVRKAKTLKGQVLRFPPVPLEKLTWILCQDACWGNRPDDLSQSESVLLLAEPQICRGEFGRIAFVEWSSRRIKRCVRSNLAAELHGLSMGIDSATRARALWREIKDGISNSRIRPRLRK